MTEPLAKPPHVSGRITLATPNVAFEQRVRQAFGGTLNGELRLWRLDERPVSPADLLSQDPDVIVLGPAVDEGTALEFAAELDRDHPSVSVVLVAEPSPALLERALRCGVRDILRPDASNETVREVLISAMRIASRHRRLDAGRDESSRGRRRIVATSPKGGAGKTMVSTNLAVALAKEHHGEVVLVDLDLAFGDVTTALQLVPEHTIDDAVRSGDRLDGMAIKVFLAPHPSGLFVLSAPDSPVRAETITADDVRRILMVLSEEFRYVIVDTASGLDEHTLTALELATDIVLICGMDVASVHGLTKELQALDELGMTAATRSLVLNRADSRVGIEPEDVVHTTGLEITVEVPSSRLVPLSMNQGTSLLETDPRSRVARSLQDLTVTLVPSETSTGQPWWKKVVR